MMRAYYILAVTIVIAVCSAAPARAQEKPSAAPAPAANAAATSNAATSQPAQPNDAQPPSSNPYITGAAAPSTPAQAAPATAAGAAPAAASTGSEPATVTQAPATEGAPRIRTIFPSPEALRLARERWQIEVMRARARQANQLAQASSNDAPALQAELPPARHGNAGAPIAIGANWDTGWNKDPGYDAFSDNDIASRFGLWAAYDVASLRSDLIAALELGWGTEHTADAGLQGGALNSELWGNTLYGGAQLRWVPSSWLQPHARLAAGASVMNMTLQASSVRFADREVSPFASLGLGFTLRTPSRLFEDRQGSLARLSLGLMLEGGYTLAGPLDFAADGPASSKRQIALIDSKLGRLDRSGPYARASIVVRF